MIKRNKYIQIFIIFCLFSILFQKEVFSTNTKELDSFLDSMKDNEKGITEETKEEIEEKTNDTEENKISNIEEERFKQNAEVRILNKMTGKSFLINKPIGKRYEVENLEFQFLKCWRSYPDEVTENKLLLKVIETDEETNIKKTIFYGWIFSSSPSLNGLEHKFYDITLINCSN